MYIPGIVMHRSIHDRRRAAYWITLYNIHSETTNPHYAESILCSWSDRGRLAGNRAYLVIQSYIQQGIVPPAMQATSEILARIPQSNWEHGSSWARAPIES